METTGKYILLFIGAAIICGQALLLYGMEEKKAVMGRWGKPVKQVQRGVRPVEQPPTYVPGPKGRKIPVTTKKAATAEEPAEGVSSEEGEGTPLPLMKRVKGQSAKKAKVSTSESGKMAETEESGSGYLAAESAGWK